MVVCWWWGARPEANTRVEGGGVAQSGRSSCGARKVRFWRAAGLSSWCVRGCSLWVCVSRWMLVCAGCYAARESGQPWHNGRALQRRGGRAGPAEWQRRGVTAQCKDAGPGVRRGVVVKLGVCGAREMMRAAWTRTSVGRSSLSTILLEAHGRSVRAPFPGSALHSSPAPACALLRRLQWAWCDFPLFPSRCFIHFPDTMRWRPLGYCCQHRPNHCGPL
jgi:hypothetical protein